jgi:diguanylate cyclase (GGDEF)-like protein
MEAPGTVRIAEPETDELTGLHNRRAFFAHAQEAFASAVAGGAKCAAVFIDLDRLQYVNDTYGHHIGTELLREAAAALTTVATPLDIVGRLGGDEFALLRPGCEISADELRRQVADQVERGSQSGSPHGLEVSVGIAVVSTTEVRSIDKLLSLADEDMYREKQASGGQHRGPHVRRRDRI